ncbi:MAG: nitrate- and nitrite sensing domain-containing protein [Verrucomicrobia bacterium]|nr:nitrate- and nitrite sensing domain-containing protein [Verrucomicrobiota bacterium]
MNLKSLSSRLLILVLPPIAGLSFFGIRGTMDKWGTYRAYQVLEKNSAVLQQIGSAVHELQKERGRSAGFLGSKGKQFVAELAEQRQAVDGSLNRLRRLLDHFDPSRFGGSVAGKFQAAQEALRQIPDRRKAVDALALPPTESTTFYTQVISSLLEAIVAMSHLSKDAEVADGIYGYVNFLQAKEQAGIERATLSGAFSANEFTPESLRTFNQVSARQDTFLRVFASFASDTQRQFLEDKVKGPAIEAVAEMRRTAATKATTGAFGIAASAWFDAATTRINLMKEVEDRLAADYDANADRIKRDAWRQFLFFALFTSVVILLTCVIAYRTVRAIARQLLTLAGRLSDGASDLIEAANQVASSSQASASGANQQATSLRETAGTLEQMSTMTRTNAQAADEAKTLSGQARAAADTGSTEMEVMRQAMDAIKASAANIAKVVKSIDEIAFQTNILALNAAVEAARAGEAGAGFAVVAEEVRALAQRSAQAARETAQMIEESVGNSERGVDISSRVGRHFQEIVAKARQVDTLVAQIAVACQEQTKGISQANVSVSQMEKITEAGAQGAEETATRAAELNQQAHQLTTAVGELMLLANGQRENDPLGLPGQPQHGGKRARDQRVATSASEASFASGGRTAPVESSRHSVLTPARN